MMGHINITKGKEKIAENEKTLEGLNAKMFKMVEEEKWEDLISAIGEAKAIKSQNQRIQTIIDRESQRNNFFANAEERFLYED